MSSPLISFIFRLLLVGWSVSDCQGHANFQDWIHNMEEEVTSWQNTTVEGTIPSYVRGTLLRNGAGLWTVGDNDMYSHLFDGLAKISAFRIRHDGDDDESSSSTTTTTVEYINRFVDSQIRRRSLKRGRFPVNMQPGPILLRKRRNRPKGGLLSTLRVLMSVRHYDNVAVSLWDYSPGTANTTFVTALTDNRAQARIALHDVSTISSQPARASKRVKGAILGMELFETAHPVHSRTSEDTYNVGVFFQPQFLSIKLPTVALVRETPDGQRQAIAKFKPKHFGIPYFHSMEVTENYGVIVVEPLRLKMRHMRRSIRVGFYRALTEVKTTQVVVIDLNTGDIVLDKAIDQKIFYFHTISAAEYEQDGDTMVSIRLIGNSNSDYITGEDQFMRLERAWLGTEYLNRIPPMGNVMDIQCNLPRGTVRVDTMDLGVDYQGMEYPTTRYTFAHGPNGTAAIAGRHPQYVYGAGAYADGGVSFESWGLFKADLDRSVLAASYTENSTYVSEGIFVPNPEGVSEDDGVVLSQIYDGNRRETALLVLDAQTFEVLAKAWTGHRGPTDFHGMWVPNAA